MSYRNRNNNGSFGFIFIEIFGGPFTPFNKICPYHGQHFKGFLVGHNQKELYIGGVVEKPLGDNRYLKGQLHTTNWWDALTI